LYEALEQIIELEVMKQAAEFPIGLWKMTDWALWSSQPSPKCKRLLAVWVDASAIGALANSRHSFPINRRNYDIMVGYSGRVALRRENVM
jgi:hypothetical protein